MEDTGRICAAGCGWKPAGVKTPGKATYQGLDHWIIQNWSATDDYGFSLRGGGCRLWTGYGFDDFGTYYNAFSTTPHPTLSHSAWIFSTYSLDSGAGVYPDRKHNGFSIRCIKGEPLAAVDVQQPAMQAIQAGGAFAAPANMVFIPPGTFQMGSPPDEKDRYSDESPRTSVTIRRGFWMGKYEVTQAEYLAVMGKNPSHFTGDETRPVDSATWADAVDYCEKLTERERAAGRITADLAYRLPTEAEWEYACRAGTATRFFYGDDPDYSQLADYAWYRQNAGFTAHPVGQKKPNPWGLYDMLGNAWEWCHDWYGAYPGGTAVDPQGSSQPGMNRQRTIRGGDYFNPAQRGRSALRGYDFVPKHPWPPDFGFRVVLAAASPQAEDRPAQSQTVEDQPRPRTADGQRSNGVGTGTVQERFNQMAEKLGLSEQQKKKLMDLQRAQYQQMGGLSGMGDPGQFKKFRAELEQKVQESSLTPPTAVKPVANMVWIQPGAFPQGTAQGADAEAYPDEYPPREVTIATTRSSSSTSGSA